MSVMPAIRALFSTPARQAAGWALVGLVGLSAAGGGIWLATDGDSDGTQAVPEIRVEAPPTRTPTSTATPSPTSSPTAAPTVTPTLAPAPRVQVSAGTTTEPEPEAVVEPTEEPTAPPTGPGGPYCNNISSSTPPNSVFGLLTIGGAPAPAGTVVTVLFDGVAGPSTTIAEAGGYKINWSAGGSDCANRVGSAVSIAVNGGVYASGVAVGSGGGTPVIRFDVAIP
jgi:hypothetical protein